MRKFLLLSFILVYLSSCSQPETEQNSLNGRWRMASVMIGGEDGTQGLDPNNDRWIIFNNDGTFASGGSVGRNSGSYTYNNGILALDSDAGPDDDSNWNVTIAADTLKMTGVGSERQQSSVIINIRAPHEAPLLSTNIKNVDASIRAVEIDRGGAVWFAGSKGKWGFSDDEGATWTIDSISYEGSYPEFRSMGITSKAVHILSVGSPALLYRTTDSGQSWQLAYTETDSSVFYDALEFWDDSDGIAVGDIMNGCISIIITRDGGESWTKVPCNSLPAGLEGEGCFAASDTNIGIVGNQVWIGTTKARIYHSSDRGRTWEIQQTPIIQGKTMTGIFSLSMYDEKNGIVFGGDWEEMENSNGNKAITNDGGSTWKLVGEGLHPGYRSCVQYIPQSGGTQLIATGIPGISWSGNAGKSWTRLSNANFYTLRLDGSGSTGWLAGRNKIARLTLD